MRGKARAFRANLDNVAKIEQMIAGALDAFGRIDILVNSASVFARKPLQKPDRALLGQNSRHQREGAVLSVGRRCFDVPGGRGENRQPRRLGRDPPVQGLPAVLGVEERAHRTHAGVCEELAPKVQVNCIALGMVVPPEEYSKREVARLVSRTLTKRMGSPEDVARAVIFFCEATDFATGATLALDGWPPARLKIARSLHMFASP